MNNGNLPAVLEDNSLNIPDQDHRRIVQLAKKGAIGPLSQDKESGLFLMYVMGDSLEDIAKNTSYPLDVIYTTALYYKWSVKKDSVGGMTTKELQEKITNLVLLGTYVTAKSELAQVIAGTLQPNKAHLLPKNIHGLERLISMINNINKIESGGTTINANNVQINNIIEEAESVLSKEEIEKETKEREAKWKALKDIKLN